MRIIVATLIGVIALAAVPAQAVLGTRNENWRPLAPALSFSLRDQACGDGWHYALRPDWRGYWWWACVPARYCPRPQWQPGLDRTI